MYALPTAATIVTCQKLGVFEALAVRSATAPELAAALELDPAATRQLLEAVAATGHVKRKHDSFSLAKRARRWLDPDSPTYVGSYIAHAADYVEWWSRLEHVVRTGDHVEIHGFSPDSPHWRTYITGQFELARLSAPEVVKAVKLPPHSTSLLDLAGGHGLFAAELCKRHQELHATVLDLPGSSRVGRELLAPSPAADRVSFRDGSLFDRDFGGVYDAALCFNILHHLSPDQNRELMRKLHASLRPGGKVAILDLFRTPLSKRPGTGDFLGLFFYLTSGAATYTVEQLESWLLDAGFTQIRRTKLKRIPDQLLVHATASG